MIPIPITFLEWLSTRVSLLGFSWLCHVVHAGSELRCLWDSQGTFPAEPRAGRCYPQHGAHLRSLQAGCYRGRISSNLTGWIHGIPEFKGTICRKPLLQGAQDHSFWVNRKSDRPKAIVIAQSHQMGLSENRVSSNLLVSHHFAYATFLHKAKFHIVGYISHDIRSS